MRCPESMSAIKRRKHPVKIRVMSAVLALIITTLSILGGKPVMVYAEPDTDTEESTSDKIKKAEELKKITEEQHQVIE